MRLATWLFEHDLTDAVFAARVGVSQTTISRVRRGVQLPDISLMDRIEVVTEGAVTAIDLIDACREVRRAGGQAANRSPQQASEAA